MKNTKGKWEASKRYDIKNNLIGISIDDTEKKIGVMITYSSKQLPMDEVQANANLIASAPEMLQELKAIELGLNHTDSDWAKERLGYVRKIIARAEGK